MPMLQRFRHHWHELRRSSPGQRFQDRYRRHRQDGRKRPRLRRVLVVLAGFGLVLVGLFFMAVPGPGIPFVLVGVGLWAGENRTAARVLDGIELRLRGLARRAVAFWGRAPGHLRAVLVLTGLVFAATASYAGYRLVF